MDKAALISELASRFDFEPAVFEDKIKEIKIALLVGDVIDSHTPTAKERKSELDLLHEHVSHLQLILDTMPGETRKELWVEFESRTNTKHGQASCDFVTSLETLFQTIEAISEHSPPRKENPDRKSQDLAITAIADLWKAMTGRQASCWVQYYLELKGYRPLVP